MPFPFTSVVASAAVCTLFVVGSVLLASYDSPPSSPVDLAPSAATNDTGTLFTNATHLAQVCLEQCGTGGVCEQDLVSAQTTCIVCGPGTSMDPNTGRCINTLECATWPWCSGDEAAPLILAHNALALTAWTGPGPNNFTYPATNLTAALPFVPYLGATATDVVDLLNTYLTGRLTLGPAYGATTYLDDSTGTWGSSLAVYKSIVPTVWVDYILSLKTRCCTRVWRAVNGTCLPPEL